VWVKSQYQISWSDVFFREMDCYAGAGTLWFDVYISHEEHEHRYGRYGCGFVWASDSSIAFQIADVIVRA
jgi:hypothetical protein